MYGDIDFKGERNLDTTQVTIAWAGKTTHMVESPTSIIILGIEVSNE